MEGTACSGGVGCITALCGIGLRESGRVAECAVEMTTECGYCCQMAARLGRQTKERKGYRYGGCSHGAATGAAGVTHFYRAGHRSSPAVNILTHIHDPFTCGVKAPSFVYAVVAVAILEERRKLVCAPANCCAPRTKLDRLSGSKSDIQLFSRFPHAYSLFALIIPTT